MWLYHPLCFWGPLQLASRWGKQKRRESLKRFSWGSHPKMAHITFLPVDLNSVTWPHKQTGESALAVCPGGKITLFWWMHSSVCLWDKVRPGEWRVILIDIYCFGFAVQLNWSESKFLPGIHWTSCQDAGTTLWNPHYNSSRRWEWPRLSHPAPTPLLCESDWVGVLGFLSLIWFVDSSRGTLWWCGSNQITPFALAGGLLYCCFPGKTYWQQGPLSTGKDAKGFPLIFSTMVRLCELKHS